MICQILFANFKHCIDDVILQTILEILVFPHSSKKLYLNRKELHGAPNKVFLFYFILFCILCTVHTVIKLAKKYHNWVIYYLVYDS